MRWRGRYRRWDPEAKGLKIGQRVGLGWSSHYMAPVAPDGPEVEEDELVPGGGLAEEAIGPGLPLDGLGFLGGRGGEEEEGGSGGEDGIFETAQGDGEGHDGDDTRGGGGADHWIFWRSGAVAMEGGGEEG
jgi:hypothetical protein